MIGNPQLVIFDIDGTLRDYETGEMLPGVEAFFMSRDVDKCKIAFASNQGGVGLRYWMELDGFGNPDSYPTAETITDELQRLVSELLILKDEPTDYPVLYMAFAYQSKKSGKWSPIPLNPDGDYDLVWEPGWRKPAPGMLIKAMDDAGVEVFDTLMVGDSDDDFQAAMAAGCNFQWAWEFFGRDNPNEIGGAV